MLTKSYRVCLLFGLVALINAQTQQEKQCDESIYAVTDFDAAAYLGRWYEYARSYARFEGGKCNIAVYSLSYDDSIKVHNTQYNESTHSDLNIEGYATFAESPSVGKLLVEFPSSPAPAPYWVLRTDYKSYSAVYSCSDMGDSSYINIWILARENNPSEAAISSAFEAFEKFDIDTSLLNKTDQTDCTYYGPDDD